MKKGFTLVELLAVIVILSLILAIAVPTISSILDTAKKSGFENNTKVLLRYLKNDYDIKTSSNTVLSDTFILFEDGVKTFYPLENTFDFSIQAKDGGIVRHSDGTITMAIHDGTNCITKLRTSNDITSTVTDKASCISNIIYKQANAPFTNLVTNGDFSNGTTGWTASGGSIQASNNILSITRNGSYTYPNVVTNITHVSGNKYYVNSQVKVTNASCFAVYLYSGTSILTVSTTPNEWQTLSSTYTSTVNNIFLYHMYNTGIRNEISYFKEVKILNLTTLFGAGNEPTKDQMDHNLNKVWIDTANNNTPKKFGGGGWTTF